MSAPFTRAVWLLVFAGLAGCSSIPKAAAMRAPDVPISARFPSTVGVRISGGQDFSFRISDAQFEQAVRESLVDAKLFADVVDVGSADHRLDVVLGDGRGVEGRELSVLWSLSSVRTKQTLWQELVTSKGKSFHFVGVTRQRRSLELAAQQNIRLGIEKLSRADLSASRRKGLLAPARAAEPTPPAGALP